MDIWADLVATGTLIVVSIATWAAIQAGIYAKGAYEATQRQLELDREALEVTQQQLQVAQNQLKAGQRPFLLPTTRPRISPDPQARHDLFVSENQYIDIQNIGYGPAVNVRATLCGKRASSYPSNKFYGLWSGKMGVPIDNDKNDQSIFFSMVQGEPNATERPDGYDNEDVRVLIARLVLIYADLALNEYQTIYEWEDNERWQVRQSQSLEKAIAEDAMIQIARGRRHRHGRTSPQS